jgi:putative phosphoribosyl transferase
MSPRFPDRRDAGQVLARQLDAHAGRADVLELGLPRGGVPVAFEVAQRLNAPLDVFVVRKLGTPGREELAMGAIASGGVRVLNERVVEQADVAPDELAAATEREQRELVGAGAGVPGDRPAMEVARRTVVLVDDGLATGATMRAAVAALRQQGAARVVVAVPAAAVETREAFRAEVDEVVCATTPDPFFAVGEAYQDFSQTTDQGVRDLLDRAARSTPRAA